MSYENPKIPEGINVSVENPLKEFFILLTGILSAVVGLVFVLSLVAQQLAQWIPFHVEVELIEAYSEAYIVESSLGDSESAAVERYLQQLGEKLARAQGLPETMHIHVHYIDDDTVNAFATLGGHIMIHRGLVKKMPNENALAMVLAHEIAHIHHRDPIVSIGRGVTVALALAVLFEASNTGVFQGILGEAGLLTVLSFNRSQEIAADERALETLQKYYGHSQGAKALFNVILEQQELISPPSFLATHPLTQDRIEMVEEFLRGQSGIPEVVPLPENIHAL